MVKPDFRFWIKLREEILRTAIEEATAELRPCDAEAFKSRSIDYASIEPEEQSRRSRMPVRSFREVVEIMTFRNSSGANRLKFEKGAPILLSSC
jgi:hypothetical protein